MGARNSPRTSLGGNDGTHGAARLRPSALSSPGLGLGTSFCLPILGSPIRIQSSSPELVGAEDIAAQVSWTGSSWAQPSLLMGTYSPVLLCYDPPEISA